MELIKSSEDAQKALRKEQKNLLAKEKKEELNNYFLNEFSSFLRELNADSFNMSSIKSPHDYKDVIGAGGAAEGTRGILAYQLAVYKQINKYGCEVVSPLVIDTPNQQEQAKLNYNKICDVLINKIPPSSQLIICALDNPSLDKYKEEANVITLDDNKILLKEEYAELSNIINELFNESRASIDS